MAPIYANGCCGNGVNSVGASSAERIVAGCWAVGRDLMCPLMSVENGIKRNFFCWQPQANHSRPSHCHIQHTIPADPPRVPPPSFFSPQLTSLAFLLGRNLRPSQVIWRERHTSIELLFPTLQSWQSNFPHLPKPSRYSWRIAIYSLEF